MLPCPQACGWPGSSDRNGLVFHLERQHGERPEIARIVAEDMERRARAAGNGHEEERAAPEAHDRASAKAETPGEETDAMPRGTKGKTAADYACHACGQTGHTARSSKCPKRAPTAKGERKATGGCGYCHRPHGKGHTSGCKAAGAKTPTPKPAPAARNGHAPDLGAVSTDELVQAIERGVAELGRRLAAFDQVRAALGAGR